MLEGYTVNPTTTSPSPATATPSTGKVASLVLVFQKDKETPGTTRFKEFVPSGNDKDAVVGTLYIKKSNPLHAQPVLTITIGT